MICASSRSATGSPALLRQASGRRGRRRRKGRTGRRRSAAPLHRHRIGAACRRDSPLFSYLNAGQAQRERSRLPRRIAARDVDVVTASRSQAGAGRRSAALLATVPARRGHDLRLRLDRSHGRPRRHRVHPAGLVGLTGFRGDPAGPPIAIGGDLGEYMGGVFAAFGALAVAAPVRAAVPASTWTCRCSKRSP
jgi:hypothetical protein